MSRSISTVDPPPPGFSYVPLGKKILLEAPVLIYAHTVEEVLGALPQFAERVHGVIVTVATGTQWTRLGPLLWHLQIPQSDVASLASTAGGIMAIIAAAAESHEREGRTAQREHHAQHELEITRRDYLRITGELIKRVNELSEAQRALSQSNEELEARVSARTAELKAANERLTEVDRLKSQFLSNMSHELRTPLNAVIGFTGVLLMRLSGPLSEEQDSQLKTIRDSSQHLLSLINDLLDMAKIEAGKMELHQESVPCQHLMGEVLTTLQPLATRKGLSLKIDAPEAPIELMSDARAVRQILLNLAGNAIKFTDRGSVTLGLRRLSREGARFVELCVRDTGVGIPAKDAQRIFQIFAQADSGARDGTGLGLHLSQQYARLLGGCIEFESEPGRGSRFALLLPQGGPAPGP